MLFHAGILQAEGFSKSTNNTFPFPGHIRLVVFEGQKLPPKSKFEPLILAIYRDDEEADESGKEKEGGKAKESAESVFAALERAPVLCSVVPSTVPMPHCAFESAVPHCAFKRTVLTLPHCALERAPDQTLRFGSGKHFSLPPTCANFVIL